jgi:hypothetical protein
MAKHSITISGYKVFCDSDREYEGLKYLKYTLSEADALALLKQVESQREVPFEDDEHRKFSLIDGENGTFTVVRNEQRSGWF